MHNPETVPVFPTPLERKILRARGTLILPPGVYEQQIVDARKALAHANRPEDEARRHELMRLREEEARHYRILGDRYLVRMWDWNTELDSQIALPETFIYETENDGQVLACGPGREIRVDGLDLRLPMEAEAGDRVLFEKSGIDFLPQTREEQRLGCPRLGFVSDGALVGVLAGPLHGYLSPANGWVKIEPDGREPAETPGGIAVPDELRRRLQSGVVLDRGLGRRRLSGPLAGTRRGIEQELNVKELLGYRVWWTDYTDVVEVTDDNDRVEFLLIDAFAPAVTAADNRSRHWPGLFMISEEPAR